MVGAASRQIPAWLRVALLCLAGLLAFSVLAAPATRAQDASVGSNRPVLEAVRIGEHPDRTRLVIELSARVEFVLTLDSDPTRLVIELPSIDWRTTAPEALAGRGLITGLDRLPDQDGVTRIVVHLSEPTTVRDVFFLGQTPTIPYRFVLDLAATAQPAPDQSTDTLRPLGDEAPAPTGPPPAGLAFGSDRPLVVIDPGHGGIDPGAVGADGTLERDITLAVSNRLRDLLAGDGRYRVYMTRVRDDQYVALRDRVAQARAIHADVFVSIHADANPSRTVRGASIYTLSDRASDREAAMLAARENRERALAEVAIDPNDDVMANILIDLVQRDTHTHSNALAEFMVNRMGAVAPLLINTHREAGFAVLTAPDVPSVLVELGHLSNPLDEDMLIDPVHQALLADALRQAIDDYFDWRALAAAQ